MPHPDHPDLFAYGTLMAPQIIGRIIGRLPESAPAHALGFQRFRVKDRSFPGIVRTDNPEDRVDGLLYLDISPAEWMLLNAYEDDFYALEDITIHTGALTPIARTYLVPPGSSHVLSDQSWDYGLFLKNDLPNYLT